jgi:hypothetical protein
LPEQVYGSSHSTTHIIIASPATAPISLPLGCITLTRPVLKDHRFPAGQMDNGSRVEMHKVAGRQNWTEAFLSLRAGRQIFRKANDHIFQPTRAPTQGKYATWPRTRCLCRPPRSSADARRRYLKSRVWVPVSFMPIVTAPAGIVPGSQRGARSRASLRRAPRLAAIRENERRPLWCHVCRFGG